MNCAGVRLSRVFVTAVFGTILVTGAVPASEPAPPKFTRGPAAVKSGADIRIEFEIDREIDAAVFIEDGGGRIVRHLAAGVLGENPPPPFKPGVTQSILWDGRADYGRPAGPGPFKVRVALGLSAKYDRVLVSNPQNIGRPKALAAGPDGTLYACVTAGASLPSWSADRIVAMDREGKFLRTVLPFPANLPKEKVAGYGVYDLDGRWAPLVKCIPERRFHAGLVPRKGSMALTPDGVILKLNTDAALEAIGVKGDAPWSPGGGPRLLDLPRLQLGRAFVCVSSDGKRAFVAGLGDNRPGKNPYTISFACVYVVDLPGRGPGRPFFGNPEEPGKDDTHLGDSPRGLALDGKGNLLIADFRNDRVVAVSETEGKYVGEFAVPKPDGVGVDPKTGAVYVLSLTKGNGGDLIKFSGWKEPKELARMPVAKEGNPDYPPVMAVDASAQPVVVWLGTDTGKLLRIEDKGAAFEGADVRSHEYGKMGFVGLEVDRFRPAPEVYFRCELTESNAGEGTWLRWLEGEDRIEKVKFPGTGGVSGTCIVPGPNGIIYAPAYPSHILRFTRDGKPAPWPQGNAGYPPEIKDKGGKMAQVNPGPPHGIFAHVSMTFMTHTLGVRPSDGHFFIMEALQIYGRPHKMLREYTAEGKRVSEDPLVWKVSDTCVGPKFDQRGNLYVAEQVKPLDQPYPPEFAPLVGRVEPVKTYLDLDKDAVKNVICTMYGSIVKFSPKGGMFHFEGRGSGGGTPYHGAPKLDPAMKTEDYGSFYGPRLNPLKVTGAEWVRMGISHVCLHRCNCENTRFDVDDFGRVWYPDLGRFRVVVLDTGGNEITHFGGYGNAESTGPESKDKSLVDPEIAFAWLIGVGATDRYAYMGDSLNRRLLRAKIVYAAEQTCDIR